MFSVVYSARSRIHGVVSHSRALLLASTFALGSWPLEALAAPPGTAPRAANLGPASPGEKSYRDLLTTSYVVAPLFAAAVGYAMAEMEVSDGGAVLGAGAMFFSPAAVHMAHGKVAHGPLAFLGLAGSTAVGTLLGGLAGYSIDSSGCDPDEDSEGCAFAGFGGLILGALLGGVAGYTGFAIYDVSVNGAVPLDEPPADRASLQLWLSPLPAARSERAEAAIPLGGIQIGALLEM